MSGALRVMSLDARAVQQDPDAFRAVVSSRAVDVVAFHEAPRYLRWRSKRAKLARQLGMVVVTTDRPGGMFVATSLRPNVLDTSFAMSSSSAGSSPAVVIATLEVGGSRWRVVVAAIGGAPDLPDSEVPAVIVAGSGTIGVVGSVTVMSCDPVDVAGRTVGPAPMLAVVEQ
ncbi:MAG TPA: hypothetical protein VG650_12930 [Mycobacteriales bacterium]|nr:hypothetical protein [Mycobacteriales bacterium]